MCPPILLWSVSSHSKLGLTDGVHTSDMLVAILNRFGPPVIMNKYQCQNAQLVPLHFVFHTIRIGSFARLTRLPRCYPTQHNHFRSTRTTYLFRSLSLQASASYLGPNPTSCHHWYHYQAASTSSMTLRGVSARTRRSVVSMI